MNKVAFFSWIHPNIDHAKNVNYILPNNNADDEPRAV